MGLHLGPAEHPAENPACLRSLRSRIPTKTSSCWTCCTGLCDPMSERSPHALQKLRAEWRDRLRAACDRAAEQVADLGVADLRALRTTIEEEMEALSDGLPAPGPVEAQGPMTPDEQTEYVQEALRYNVLRVRRQVVHHELRRRALGPGTDGLEVPRTTKHFATLAWAVMGEAAAQTPEDVYREVAERADEDVHLTTVEKWLRDKNPHHPEETDGRWAELRRAVLLAST